VAVLFAKEGADVAIIYLKEHADAADTKQIIEEEYGRRCLTIPADISKESNCIRAINRVKKSFGRIDVLVNNAALHYETSGLKEIKRRSFLRLSL
jgi:NAD(P)-dependent dehydrogenase (short-subunit alcohol dehydrogenase family)